MAGFPTICCPFKAVISANMKLQPEVGYPEDSGLNSY
jgi:hypothetical protein